MGKNIVKATVLLLLINICVKILGLIREMVIASGFGASYASDAYLVAYTIPYFLQAILGYAFVSAILPVFNSYWQDEGDNLEASRLGSTLINATAILMLVLSLVGILLAPQLVWLTAPNLPAQTAQLAGELTQIMFPSLLFMSVGMVISGILNSRYRFAAAALAPGMAALGVIIASVFFAKGNIYVVAIGTLIGYLGFFLIQAADLPNSKFRYRLVCNLRHPGVQQVMHSILPIMLGLSVNQIYTVFNRIFASGLAEGSISALNYASKLMNFPLGLFVAAVTTAVFPALAELVRRKDAAQLSATVSRGVSMILLVAIPSAVGLMLLDSQIVQLIFEGGNFDAGHTQITAAALFAMCPGLIFLGGSMLLMRVCYALQDNKTPLITGGISVLANILASLLLVGPWGHVGLAWANSIAAAVNTVLMTIILSKRVPFLNRYFWQSLGSTALATAGMAAVLVGLSLLVPAPAAKMQLMLWLAVVMVLAVGVYLLLLKLQKTSLLQDVVREWRRKDAN